MDYKKLGFRCGIEIHQQLEGKKLFCSCPTLNIRDTTPDICFERRLRAVAGETGVVDRAAKHEMEKSKRYIYEGDSRDCCLVEMDEEPPQPINKDALSTALQVAILFKAKVVDEIQVMRKTVVDGSNTSGFQRTALVAYDGILQTSKGDVRISSILLEEEACQVLERTKDFTKYRLDRLGIPLIEIGTETDIVDNVHAKEVAEKIGMVLRSTGGCKRGIGTIRQDVNVSIKGRNRVEIKGFQEIKIMPKVIENEIKRLSSLKKPEGSHVRNFNKDGTTGYLRPMPGAARMYPETDVAPIRITKDILKDIKVPQLLSKRNKGLANKYCISEDIIKTLERSGKLEIFEEIASKVKVKPAFIASTLTSTLKEITKKHSLDTDDIPKVDLDRIFEALDKGRISKDNVQEAIIDSINAELNLEKFQSASDDQIEKEIIGIIKEKPGLTVGAYMGLVMSRFKGKIDGKKAMDILKKHV